MKKITSMLPFISSSSQISTGRSRKIVLPDMLEQLNYTNIRFSDPAFSKKHVFHISVGSPSF